MNILEKLMKENAPIAMLLATYYRIHLCTFLLFYINRRVIFLEECCTEIFLESFAQTSDEMNNSPPDYATHIASQRARGGVAVTHVSSIPSLPLLDI